MSEPRLLTIMGSGETAPTMVKVHRQLIERVGGGPCALLDTPYGFQENADDLSARTQAYFASSVGFPIEVASWRDRSADALTESTALARIEAARYVFAGPGSPSYALDVWRASPLVSLLTGKLARGGAVTFASAAALTLGTATVPVYEVYKVGEAPHWLDGLDVLGAATGLRAAVIPHYDNAEGGTHDTRYCYLGERRLVRMLDLLPPGTFVLGVDEHTALVLDLSAGRGAVVGLGQLTVRTAEHVTVWPPGTDLAIDDLRAAAAATAAPATAPAPAGQAPAVSPSGRVADPAAPRASPFLADVTQLGEGFDAALAAGDAATATEHVLELDRLLVAWAADPTQSDETDRARVRLRSMVVQLGQLADRGTDDRAAVMGPLVEAVLVARALARDTGDWAQADELRARLAAAGVEVRDTPDGQTWQLVEVPGGAGGSGC